MAFHVRDRETDAVVRELARKRGIGITDAIKQAVVAELQREAQEPTRLDQIRALQARVASRGRTGFRPDKAFFDWLSGEEDA
jgi:antitoxin VapB